MADTLRNYLKTQFVILIAAKNLLFPAARPFAEFILERSEGLRVTVLR